MVETVDEVEVGNTLCQPEAHRGQVAMTVYLSEDAIEMFGVVGGEP